VRPRTTLPSMLAGRLAWYIPSAAGSGYALLRIHGTARTSRLGLLCMTRN
jgi:hypothetical protein